MAAGGVGCGKDTIPRRKAGLPKME